MPPFLFIKIPLSADSAGSPGSMLVDIILRHQVEQLLQREVGTVGPEILNELLVEFLTCRGFVVSETLRRALLATPRHLFLPDVDLRHVYSDSAVTTARNDRGWFESSCSTPSIVCTMLEALELDGARNILEIGAGTGFTAALMAHCAPEAHITTLEVLEDVARSAEKRLADLGLNQIEVRCADGRGDTMGPGPYDRIIFPCGPPVTPSPALDLLVEGGILVIPLAGCIFVFCRQGGRLRGRPLILASFIAFRNGLPQSTWRQQGDTAALWPRNLAGREPDWQRPDHRAEGPVVHSHQVATWMLWSALRYPEDTVMLTEKDRGWGFGLHDPGSNSTIICRLDGRFTFRHYGNLIETPHFECWGDTSVGDRFFAVSELLSDLGWPDFERLEVTVEPLQDPFDGSTVSRFAVGDHLWQFEISGFEVCHGELAGLAEEPVCASGVNEEDALPSGDRP